LKSEEFQFCPKCGSALQPAAGAAPEGAPSPVTCSACGTTFEPATFRPSELAIGGAQPAVTQGGNRNPFALVLAIVVAAGLLYFGVHMARHSAAPTGAYKSAPAPDFTLESLDGNKMTLSELRGKAVLLNFWATWCGPCKIETPWLVELQNKYGAQGLQVIGVAMDDSGKDDIAKFAKDMGVNYPVLLGKEAVGDAYGGVPALPESFFIGRDGKIVDKIIGLKGKAEIEDSIKMALGTQAGKTTLAPVVVQAQN